MAERAGRSPAIDSESEITLGLLEAVQADGALTQRSAASQLGIALGLTNAYLKRCVKKGLIKVKQVPPNRYSYYLTPKGFTEKSRLTAEYLSYSFTIFRRARNECADIFGDCAGRGWRRVALCGTGDVAEIATLCAREQPEVEIAGVVAREPGLDRAAGYLGLPLAAYLMELGPVDAVILTDLRAPQATYDWLRGQLPDDRVLAPLFLRVTRAAGNSGAAGDASAARA